MQPASEVSGFTRAPPSPPYRRRSHPERRPRHERRRGRRLARKDEAEACWEAVEDALRTGEALCGFPFFIVSGTKP